MNGQTKATDLVAAAYAARRPDDEALLLTANTPSLRARERIRLLSIVPSYQELLALDQSDVEQVIGRQLDSGRWVPTQRRRDVERGLRWLDRRSRSMVWLTDPEYPELLREIFDPPATLFVRGSGAALDRLAVAVVGTRRPDAEGIEAGAQSGAKLAGAGCAVTSGLAYGIDAAAHRGTVAVNGCAVAVLASGIDAVYPIGNRGLATAILESGGVLVSEYAPGTAAQKYHFPARNRIIVGLSAAALIVQAPETSGALITAEFALNENRDLFIHETGRDWAGTRRLVADGAPLIDDAATIPAILGMRTPSATVSSEPDERTVARQWAESEQQKLAMFGAVYAEVDDRMMRYTLASIHREDKR